MRPFCEGYHLNHGRDQLLPLSLALFFSFLHFSDDMSFVTITLNLSYTIMSCLRTKLAFPLCKCLSPLTFNTFALNLSFSI